MYRRSFIKAAGLGLGVGLAPSALALFPKGETDELILSAASDRGGHHFVTAIDAQGRVRFKIPTPSRAHGSLLLKKEGLAVFFSRRPGFEMLVVDTYTGKLHQQITASENRHYFGHGCQSHDGRYLYTTENAFNDDPLSGHGVIGIYDIADNFSRIGEFDCQGIGPHQIERLPHSNTLVIAMGGILTHPERRREKLNIATMRSSLCYLDGDSGEVLAQVEPPNPQLSLRHLRVSSDAKVIAGAQYQGDISEMLPLVFSHRFLPGQKQQELVPFQADELTWLGLKQYIASVAVDPSNRYAITTAPRGDCVDLWSINSGRQLNRFSIKDVAGAIWQPKQQGFLVSTGRGELVLLRINAEGSTTSHRLAINNQLRWDNHLFG
ncbi:hypothetical protein EDC56_2587 [Sinobacterium caligoides]|uniref:DUF1513 domain-containing protein n=1 Tax=Sinobacterium caligoides TaxID=933926 RepID=A0A3N2DJH9_9GAMM|nr:DUF1513 domain-containing protein [Sinobacterium caligoides]ROR99952.1 hypothetical protein EDC56_2587 [Sinobacterium caligoides]